MNLKANVPRVPLAAWLVLWVAATLLHGENWPQWRGPLLNGSTTETNLKARFSKQEDLLGSGVYGDPGLALAVKRDPLGIGFNNLGYIYDSKTRKQLAGIRVLPIDLNNDGKITPEENFYDSIDDLITAVANGKYPSPPARDLYFVANGKPVKPEVLAFLDWILTNGQQYVHEAGYVELLDEKIATEKLKLK